MDSARKLLEKKGVDNVGEFVIIADTGRKYLHYYEFSDGIKPSPKNRKALVSKKSVEVMMNAFGLDQMTVEKIENIVDHYMNQVAERFIRKYGERAYLEIGLRNSPQEESFIDAMEDYLRELNEKDYEME